MKNNIQTRLFITFSILVIIVSLFYARMTYIFMDVTKEAIATVLIEQEIQQLNLNQALPLSSSNSSNNYFKLKKNINYNRADLKKSSKDDTLYIYNDNQKTLYLKKLKDNHNKNFWLILDFNEILPITIFYNIFSIFYWGIVVGTIILALLVSWFLSKKLAHPLLQLTRSIQSQSPKHKCEIYGVSRQDEIGLLARTFQNTYEELQQAWKREYDFTQDVGHELRTPITIIRNTLALHKSQSLDTYSSDLIEQSTKSMQLTIDTLLGLARKENLTFTTCKLTPHIERSVIDILKSYPSSQFKINIELNEQYQVYGNPNLIQLLCHNLIYNAFVHGDPNSMTIKLISEENVIEFTNTFGSKPSKINHNGLGRGTYLIERIAKTMKWQLKVKVVDSQYVTQLTTS